MCGTLSFTLGKTGGTKVWDGWIIRPKGNRGLPPSVLQGVTILSCWCCLCSNPVRYQQWDDKWVSSFSPSLSLGLTYKLWNFRDAASSVQMGSMQSCSGQTKLMDFSYYCPREEILVGLKGWGQGCRHLWSEAILENSSAPDKCFFILKGKQLCCKRKCNEFDSDEFFSVAVLPSCLWTSFFLITELIFYIGKNTSRLFLMQVQDFKELPESKLAELHQQ